MGYAEVIEAKTGQAGFRHELGGGAHSERRSALRPGHVQVALDKGQIAGLKPGAGRVRRALPAWPQLPRRLALDFSDLTDKGFAFDTVRGDFDLRDGSAYTDNVLVKGPAAEIGLIGRVGLKNKDYDQTAVVTGNVQQFAAAGGICRRTGGRRRRAAVHTSVQTAAEGSGAGVLSDHGNLGQSDRRTHQERRRRRRVRGGDRSKWVK